MIGSAPTGSGKTAAFALPILHRLSEDPFGIFALILTPTRYLLFLVLLTPSELAIQISQQFSALGSPMKIKVSTIIGGKGILRLKGLSKI